MLSQAVVDAGAVPLLVLCIQEPEMPLKRIAASALSDICKHSPEVRTGLTCNYVANHVSFTCEGPNECMCKSTYQYNLVLKGISVLFLMYD